jgi:hypothetical protein
MAMRMPCRSLNIEDADISALYPIEWLEMNRQWARMPFPIIGAHRRSPGVAIFGIAYRQ